MRKHDANCAHADIKTLTVGEEDVCCFVSEGRVFEVIDESTNRLQAETKCKDRQKITTYRRG